MKRRRTKSNPLIKLYKEMMLEVRSEINPKLPEEWNYLIHDLIIKLVYDRIDADLKEKLGEKFCKGIAFAYGTVISASVCGITCDHLETTICNEIIAVVEDMNDYIRREEEMK